MYEKGDKVQIVKKCGVYFIDDEGVKTSEYYGPGEIYTVIEVTKAKDLATDTMENCLRLKEDARLVVPIKAVKKFEQGEV